MSKIPAGAGAVTPEAAQAAAAERERQLAALAKYDTTEGITS